MHYRKSILYFEKSTCYWQHPPQLEVNSLWNPRQYPALAHSTNSRNMTDRPAEQRTGTPQPPTATSAMESKSESVPAVVAPTTKFGQAKVDPMLAPMGQADWKRSPGFQKAVAYVNKIKTRFDKSVTYDVFLRLLRLCEMEQIGINLVCEIIKVIFKNHPDLVSGFTCYFPQGHPAATGPRPGVGGAGGEQNTAQP